jgi:hypothetical protein
VRLRLMLACGAAVLAAGCAAAADQPDTGASQSNAVPSSKAAVVATPSGAAADQAAASHAIAAYLNVQHAYDKAARTADYQDKTLGRYAGDPALHELQAYLFQLTRSGIVLVVRGAEPSYAPTVVSVELTKSPPQIVLRDCPDSRSVYAVFKATGKSAEPSGPAYQPHRKHPVMATVRQYGGRWLVVELGGSRVQTC